MGDHFRQQGLRVAFNDPYRGGFITTHHGRPAEQIHAIQIEMRRDLYMDEAHFQRRPDGMTRLSSAIAGAAAQAGELQPEVTEP